MLCIFSCSPTQNVSTIYPQKNKYNILQQYFPFFIVIKSEVSNCYCSFYWDCYCSYLLNCFQPPHTNNFSFGNPFCELGKQKIASVTKKEKKKIVIAVPIFYLQRYTVSDLSCVKIILYILQSCMRTAAIVTDVLDALIQFHPFR